MPKTGYQTCREIMQDLAKGGYKKQVSFEELNKSIIRCAGVSKRTKLQYLRALREVGFIRSEGESVFVLNYPGDFE